MSAIAKILGTEYPIILGAMSRINNPELVAAVSDAGGYGLLVAKNCANADELKAKIAIVRGLTDKPFGVNLAARDENAPEFIKVLVAEGIRAVTTSAGPPTAIVPMCKDAGLKVLHVVGNVKGAERVQESGADAVIAEGGESGGLQGPGGIGTMVLIPAVCDAVDIPVAAAGGIADSRGYRAAMALGAQGVQAGTAFISAAECKASDSWKEALCQAGVSDTMLQGKGGKVLARVISEELAEMLGGKGEFWPAGQVTGLIHQIRPVADIIRDMVA